MRVVLIGSGALKFHTPIERQQSDLDIIGSYDDVQRYVRRRTKVHSFYPVSSKKWLALTSDSMDNKTHIECEITWEDSSAEQFYNIVKADKDTRTYFDDVLVPSIDALYALKMSHRFLRNSPHFWKTHDDIMLLRSLGAKISAPYEAWFKRREAETYNYGHPNLNVDKGSFFKDDGVGYVYDHDTIHEAMKHLDKPAYTYFKPDDKEVWCSKELFFSVSEETRLYAVLEEVMVLALERSQIPYPESSPRASFERALQKVCTSITSGFFREFSWENARKIQSMYEDDYVEKFRKGVETGLVKPV